jgi:class 3 adenylate cyclase
MTLFEYGFRRSVMWVFTTPIMIKLYSDANYLTIQDVGIQYNTISTVINVCFYPYKELIYYPLILLTAYSSMFIFMYKLYYNIDRRFTNIYITIWSMFMVINIIEMLGIADKYTINIYYLIMDIIGKLVTNIIIQDYYDQEQTIINKMDLQSINFTSNMLNAIKIYREENKKISVSCNRFINYTHNRFVSKLPTKNDNLQIELLQKILPFGFDKEYIKNTHDSINSDTKSIKQYDMICILFTDIVNYTELAKKYDDKTIFELLHNVYNKFDNIIKQYSHLQKVETIGDAYMVVGDIYRDVYNHQVVIKEMILLAHEYISEIKKIETPDNIPLQLRVGMTMGKVSIGILGNEIPRLCVVGNAVNVASRLQSTADPDTIQMSRHIYEQLQEITFEEAIEVTKKENVFLKNLGTINTFVITPPPSINDDSQELYTDEH